MRQFKITVPTNMTTTVNAATREEAIAKVAESIRAVYDKLEIGIEIDPAEWLIEEL